MSAAAKHRETLKSLLPFYWRADELHKFRSALQHALGSLANSKIAWSGAYAVVGDDVTVARVAVRPVGGGRLNLGVPRRRFRSTALDTREQFVDAGSNFISRRGIPDLKRLEVCPAAFDFGGFGQAEIVQESARFRFDYEIQPLARIGIHKNRPVRVIASEWRRHGEPVGKLGVHFDGDVLFKLVCETSLCLGFVYHLLVD